MAAAAQKAWCSGMRKSMCEMTAATKAVAISGPSQASFKFELGRIQSLSPQWLDMAMAHFAAHSEASFTSTRFEHKLLANYLTHLLTALVPQLDRLGSMLNSETACSVGTAAEALFWELWMFLFAGCSAFSASNSKWPDLWPAGMQPFDRPLCLAFHALLRWLLPMSRRYGKRGLHISKKLLACHYHGPERIRHTGTLPSTASLQL